MVSPIGAAIVAVGQLNKMTKISKFANPHKAAEAILNVLQELWDSGFDGHLKGIIITPEFKKLLDSTPTLSDLGMTREGKNVIVSVFGQLEVRTK